MRPRLASKRLQGVVPARLRGKSLGRRAIFWLIVAGGVAAFILTSLTVYGQPSVRRYGGWIAVLEHESPENSDQVALVASTIKPGGDGEHPWLRYSVAVC